MDPIINELTDAIIQVSSCGIGGSDLLPFNGVMPDIEKGGVIGHDCMCEVVEIGRHTKNLRIGDRVVVPFAITSTTISLLYGVRVRSGR
ncbi:alcohol dehydrogenase catalytic domain-containing protein (plasmid) [Robbsia andropogonis]|uniref:alcohol dehydrogenase catalytic domain-containing protein n=1 Tax=Robbsia andropogonis TaxID=28092 RepID=UPI003D192BE3